MDGEYQKILDALSLADLKEIAAFMGAELSDITKGAFQREADPATGKKWEPIKPRGSGSARPGTTKPILDDGGRLRESLNESYRISDDGSVVFGTNVIYARIHQEGGVTGAHEIKPRHKRALAFNGRMVKKVNHPGSRIPARPFMGVPGDFGGRIMNDPAIRKLLGIP